MSGKSKFRREQARRAGEYMTAPDPCMFGAVIEMLDTATTEADADRNFDAQRRTGRPVLNVWRPGDTPKGLPGISQIALDAITAARIGAELLNAARAVREDTED